MTVSRRRLLQAGLFGLASAAVGVTAGCGDDEASGGTGGDSKELALALKGASEAVKTRIFKNMSSRAADMLREDMSVSGPVRLRNVEEAQQRIVKLIRRLEEADEIVISRGGAADLVV